MNNYIEENVVKPIQFKLSRVCCEKEYPWYEIFCGVREARSKRGLSSELHQAMAPYYKKLLMADPILFQDKEVGRRNRSNILDILREEVYCSGYTAPEPIDLVVCARNWFKNASDAKHPEKEFMGIIQTLFSRGYTPNYERVYSDLCRLLTRTQEFGHYKELEMYCILLAYLLVHHQDIPANKKLEYYKQISNNWDFLKYMYSIMLHYMVGMKFENFAGVAGSLANCRSYHSHMQLAYKAFKKNLEFLCPDNGLIDPHTHKNIRKQAELHLEHMEQVIKTTPYDDQLEPLCKILFPKKIEDVLAQCRPKTYEELECDIASLNASYTTMVKQLADCISSSLSIDEIEKAFAKFTPDLALSFYSSLNNLMAQNDTWRKYSAQIQQHILERQQTENEKIMKKQEEFMNMMKKVAEKPSTVNNNFEKNSCNFNAGSSMNGDVRMNTQK